MLDSITTFSNKIYFVVLLLALLPQPLTPLVLLILPMRFLSSLMSPVSFYSPVLFLIYSPPSIHFRILDSAHSWTFSIIAKAASIDCRTSKQK